MSRVNLFFIYLTAPLAGALLAVFLLLVPRQVVFSAGELSEPASSLEDATYDLRINIYHLRRLAEEKQQQYMERQGSLEELNRRTGEHQRQSIDIYEQRILSWLGPPVYTHSSWRCEIKVFNLKGIDYRGYMAKVKLFDPEALRVTYVPGPGETTSAAAKRTGAIFAVNGGGFYWGTVNGRGQILPMGNTIIDGQLVGEFEPLWGGWRFVGFDARGRLIGGQFQQREALEALGARHGVTFIPMLVKDRQPHEIPATWQNTRHPRTVVGEYANGDLLFIVVDGRRQNWSLGVTLEDMRQTLIDFGVINAYNLDGGGSSTFVFNNRVLNRPSDGKERAMATNIVILP